MSRLVDDAGRARLTYFSLAAIVLDFESAGSIARGAMGRTRDCRLGHHPHPVRPPPVTKQPSAGNRNSVLSADNNWRSAHSSHFRAATDPTERVTSPVNVPKRTGELIAFFKEKTNDRPSLHARSTSVPSGPRSPSPFTPTYSYNPRPTCSTSPTKPQVTATTSQFATGDYTDYTPSTYTQTQTGVIGTYTAVRTQGSHTPLPAASVTQDGPAISLY